MSSESARLRQRRQLRGWLFVLAWLALAAPTAASAAAGEAQEAQSATPREVQPIDDGPIFLIADFMVVYREEHPDHPPISEILPLDVELGRTATGFVAPRSGLVTERVMIGGNIDASPPLPFHASAINAINRALLAEFHSHGLLGVFVVPDPEDIDVSGPTDLRAGKSYGLRIEVWTGRVDAIRTIARAPRIPPQSRINNRRDRRIMQRSPIQPIGQGHDDTTDLLRKDVLENYLFHLNRHPGRYVEAGLSASPDGEGVALDYMVSEAKPWFVYGLLTDTGTFNTDRWQQRYGFVHRQLTRRDDILSIEYGNTGWNNVHAVRANYEAPWFDAPRPSWMNDKPSDPSWFKRSSIPWLGSANLRWYASFNWNRFEADLVDLSDDYVGQEFGGGLGFIYTAFQHRALFIDLILGFKLRNIEVLNASKFDPDSLTGSGEQLFWLPLVGIEAERVNEFSSFGAFVGYEASPLSGDDEDIQNLGRIAVDDRFQLLRWDVGISHYLEPLLFPKAWADPKSALSSTLAHELAVATRGQYGFDYRLIPQTTWQLGGLYSIRGYRQNEASGDTVVMGTAEYRFHLPHSLPIRREPLQLPVFGDFRMTPQQAYGRTDWDLIFSGFVDAGHSIRNRPQEGANEHDNTLIGVGAGVELRIRQNIRARFDWGRALKTTYLFKGIDSNGNYREIVSTPKGSDEFHFLVSVLY